MRVLLINVTCGVGSHGRICQEIADAYEKEGHTVKIAYGRKNKEVPGTCEKYAVRIGKDKDIYWHAIYSMLLDRHGFASKKATMDFLKWVDEYDPDLVWLHNIHGYYINVDKLFMWIKKHPQKKILWTLHDCWAFTGHCGHYMVSNCKKWMTGCYDCPERSQYPKSLLIDNSKKNYTKKRSLFTGIKELEIIVPSKWLSEQVKHSFLKDYKVTVVNNKIDRTVFVPTKSHYRNKLAVGSKFIILGVANRWTERKGLKDFELIANKINGDCVIILVGINQKQTKKLPNNIIGIERTESCKELAKLYSMANVFVNPTYEENYPTVNLEAELCGTPVITYDAGGSRETIHRKDSRVVSVGDIGAIVEIINKMRSFRNGFDDDGRLHES